MFQNHTIVGAKEVPKVARTVILDELCWPKLWTDSYVPLMEISCPKVKRGCSLMDSLWKLDEKYNDADDNILQLSK